MAPLHPRRVARILPIIALVTASLAAVAPSSDVHIAPAQVCVDVNTISTEALQEIIHIAPKRALQIIELRTARPFSSVDDLVRAKGIAAQRLADIKRQGIACVGAKQ